MIDERKLSESNLHNDLKTRLLARRAYSTYEIDDLLLGPLEDIASLEDQLSFDVIYQFFSYYICRVWENGEIKRYVRGARTERAEAADIYLSSESLAERCAKEERSEGDKNPARRAP
jgi:hypothetical protein